MPEYVSGFCNNKHTDSNYLNELKERTDNLGMNNHLILVAGANLADLDAPKRKQAVEAHHAWVDAVIGGIVEMHLLLSRRPGIAVDVVKDLE